MTPSADFLIGLAGITVTFFAIDDLLSNVDNAGIITQGLQHLIWHPDSLADRLTVPAAVVADPFHASIVSDDAPQLPTAVFAENPVLVWVVLFRQRRGIMAMPLLCVVSVPADAVLIGETGHPAPVGGFGDVPILAECSPASYHLIGDRNTGAEGTGELLFSRAYPAVLPSGVGTHQPVATLCAVELILIGKIVERCLLLRFRFRFLPDTECPLRFLPELIRHDRYMIFCVVEHRYLATILPELPVFIDVMFELNKVPFVFLILQDPRHRGPVELCPGLRCNALAVQVVCDLPDGESIGCHLEDFQHAVCILIRNDLSVCILRVSEHPLDLLDRFLPICLPLDRHFGTEPVGFTLRLPEGGKQCHEQLPAFAERIDLLQLEVHANAPAPEKSGSIEHRAGVPGKPCDGLCDDQLELPVFRFFEHPLESRSCFLESRDAEVIVDLDKLIAWICSDRLAVVLDLVFQ